MPRLIISYQLSAIRLFSIFFSVFLLVTCYLLLVTFPTFAQFDIASVYDVSDKDAKDGDILVFVPDKGIIRANIAYDVHLFGILQASPSATFRRVDNSGLPVIRAGVGNVNVTTLNGSIKPGDRITSSEIPGFGVKADLSGQSVGVAIEKFDDKDGQAFSYKGRNLRSGQIPVAIKIEYAELTTPRSVNSFFTYLGVSLLTGLQDPRGFGQVIRYFFAGLIVVIAVIFSLIILLRSIPKSIEAIGRNPLARRAITISIGLNIFIVSVITLGAILAAFIIIKL